MCTFIQDTNTGLYLAYDPATDIIIWVPLDAAYCFKDNTGAAIVLSMLNAGGGTQYVGRPGDRGGH